MLKFHEKAIDKGAAQAYNGGMENPIEAKHELFARTPIAKALTTLAVPTIISQLITMLYNLADTYFVGRSNDPLKVAAVSLCYTFLFFTNALANLFGIGGGSLMARLLGERREEDAGRVAAFSFYGSVALGALYVVLFVLFKDPLLTFFGASEATIGYCRSYADFVVLLGGVPMVTSVTLAHLLRSEGHSARASLGLGIGGLLNIVLDPLFMFVLLPKGNEVLGAAVATLLSNVFSLLFFLFSIVGMKDKTVLSLSPRRGFPTGSEVSAVFSVGLPSALASTMACASNMILMHLASAYGDIAVAAAGIVKKVDMLPMNTGMGLCQGMIPLVAYNYASGDYARMRGAMKAARVSGIVFALGCVVAFELWAPAITGLFIQDQATIALASRFLRIAAITTPLTITCFQMNYSLQAIGKGKEALFISVSRQGLVNIPCLFLMNRLFAMTGVMFTQLLSDLVTLLIAFSLWYRKVEPGLRKLETAPSPEAGDLGPHIA